jgi:formylglycine-generating enzyme required for sulfatase activity
MPQGQVGRGELILAKSLCGIQGMAALAEDLHMAYVGEEPQAQRNHAYKSQKPVASTKVSSPAPEADPEVAIPDDEPIRYLRVLKDVLHKDVPPPAERPEWYKRAKAATEEDRHGDLNATPPSPPPLMPWPRLWPILHQLLGRQQATRYLEPRRAVDHIAQQKPLEKVPRRTRLTWANHVLILFDVSDHLMPYRHDVRTLLKRLSRLRGETGLEIQIIEPGRVSWTRRFNDPEAEYQKFQTPVTGTLVLALSDLGCLNRNPNAVNPWLRIGRKLKQAGCPALALTPSPQRRWHRELAAFWQGLVWDRHASPKACAMHGPFCEAVHAKLDPDIEELLSVLYPLIRIDPAILRAVRQRFTNADVGSESELWQASDRMANGGTYLSWYQKPREKQRESFQDYANRADQLLEIIETYHGHLPKMLWQMEQTLVNSVFGKASENHEDHISTKIAYWLEQHIVQHGQAGPDVAMMRSFVYGLSLHLPEQTWRDEPGLAALYAASFRDLEVDEQPKRPAELPPEMLEGFLGQDATNWDFRQLGQEIQYQTAFRERPKNHSVNPDIGNIDTRDGWLRERVDSTSTQINLNRFSSSELKLNETRITNHRQTLTLAYEPKPEWAQTIWRDQEGLHVTVQKQGEKPRELIWLQPGSLPLLDAETDSSWHLEKGRWLDAGQWRSLKDGLKRPAWASTFGWDEYGIYADFTVKYVTQRMRLIWPDLFLMGSPEDEEGCLQEWEKQHSVLLTRAFWLAETACTQALWQAVMRKNPSYFKGIELPVEKVNWQDTQSMLRQINPSNTWRLPTEAEWEYACRAGTTTAYHFGNRYDAEKANGREGGPGNTEPVKHYDPNAWGLYQMHGNVYEWCEDEWTGSLLRSDQHYVSSMQQDAAELQQSKAQLQLDPVVLTAENMPRVVRGGGWFFNFRWLRSACRDGYRPDIAGYSIGFRFALDLETD